jgi:prophage antirepressor-like protein
MAFLVRAAPPSTAGSWALRHGCATLLRSGDGCLFGGTVGDDDFIQKLDKTLKTSWKREGVRAESLGLDELRSILGENPVDILPTLTEAQKRKRQQERAAYHSKKARLAVPPAPEAPPTVVAEEVPAMLFDPKKQQLALNGKAVRVFSVGDETWFQVKPLIVYLEYTNITVTLQRLDADDVKSLDELSNFPDFVRPDLTTSGKKSDYHENKALYVNEPGLYGLVLGSQKPQALAFKRWLTHDVLPALRRTGSYGAAASSSDMSGILALLTRQQETSSQLAQQMTEMAQQLAELRAAPPSERMHVNLNVSSTRRNEDLEALNVSLATPQELVDLKIQALPVTIYLREKLPRAADRRQVLSRFSQRLKALKTEECLRRGVQMRYVGQLDRAQPLYLQTDRPLMDQAFGEIVGRVQRSIESFFR